MTIKEKLQKAKLISYGDNIHIFDNIYIVQQRGKHSSGYHFIYGSILNKETNEEEFYSLSRFSDVIDFEDMKCEFDWFCSIDIPEYNVFRLWTRHNYKFYIEYFHTSSFKISIKKVI